jgi:hypothetical protein
VGKGRAGSSILGHSQRPGVLGIRHIGKRWRCLIGCCIGRIPEIILDEPNPASLDRASTSWEGLRVGLLGSRSTDSERPETELSTTARPYYW